MRSIAVVTLLVVLAAPAAVQAQKPGELWIKLVGTDYAKPFLEGAEYEDHEFENNGTKLIIRIGDIATEHTFEIRPHNDALAAARVTTIEKRFKPKRVRGERARRLVQSFTVKFEKKSAEKPRPAPAPPKPAAEPAEKPAAEPAEKPAEPAEKPAEPAGE